ncbi:hypothetical protein HPB50_015285 [Hyalomma asiaticum]|uniref:Uncharacterized protein n=1 Tax=Hyalomma asiaticum TaxID=266040 RepID=A0ACB7RZM0_HYAAI|nr:hypothetical protein HPB50_015285 [Hyalomma asiaticum]
MPAEEPAPKDRPAPVLSPATPQALGSWIPPHRCKNQGYACSTPVSNRHIALSSLHGGSPSGQQAQVRSALDVAAAVGEIWAKGTHPRRMTGEVAACLFLLSVVLTRYLEMAKKPPINE